MKKTPITLSDHFTYKRLLRFTLPPIFMMIFTSVYSVVDGLFVSNFVGEEPFTAVNLIYPFVMALSAFGFMFGSGGTAVVSKTLGEGDKLRANKYFTLIVIVNAATGVLLSVLGLIFLRPVAELLGGKAEILELAVRYGRIILIGLPFFTTQNLFQSFFIAAERPKLGFLVTVASGVTNMVLDALFVAVFRWGLEGAAIATTISQFVGGVVPIIYFSCKNSSMLRFVKTEMHGKVLFDTCTNGSSELLSNIAMSLISMVFNAQLMNLVGNNGVAAYGVIMYVSFIFVAIFIGYTIGMAPIVGYNYGANNREELQNIFKKSLILISITGVVMFGAGVGLSYPLGYVFFRNNKELCDMTAHAMQLYSLCFLVCGFNIFASAFFTALNNGLISAVMSFSRTIVFELICVFVLPIWLGVDGVWLSVVVGDVLCFILCAVLTVVYNKKYGYFPTKNQVGSSSEE